MPVNQLANSHFICLYLVIMLREFTFWFIFQNTRIISIFSHVSFLCKSFQLTNLLCNPDGLPTRRPTCLCFPSAEIKGTKPPTLAKFSVFEKKKKKKIFATVTSPVLFQSVFHCYNRIADQVVYKQQTFVWLVLGVQD